MSSQAPEPEPKYSAMTINERLFVAGLLDAFDEAVRTGEKERMIEILVQIEIDRQQAASTVEGILAHPTRFGRLAPPSKSTQ